MKNVVENAKKKYKDTFITEEKLMELLSEAIDSANSQKDTNISLDVLTLSELEKKVCLYLKEQIQNEDIEAEILAIEKYKFVFNRLKQEYTTEQKEELIKEALLKYTGKELFSLYLLHYIKRQIDEEKTEEIDLDLNKLKEVVKENKIEVECNDEDSMLYRYFYDIDDIMNSHYSMKEKAVILLRFGYIKDNYYSELQISEMLNLDYDYVKDITTSNIKKAKIVYENNLSEHKSEKDKIESVQKELKKTKKNK